MKIFVDTNVVLDVLLSRTPFLEDSQAALEEALQAGHCLYFSSSAATDVYYLVRKKTGDRDLALQAIIHMAEFLDFAEVNGDCILSAAASRLPDFEDAVVDEVASLVHADCILTRNVGDFRNANHPAIHPADFVRQYGDPLKQKGKRPS